MPKERCEPMAQRGTGLKTFAMDGKDPLMKEREAKALNWRALMKQ